jgi:hypothetical protein
MSTNRAFVYKFSGRSLGQRTVFREHVYKTGICLQILWAFSGAENSFQRTCLQIVHLSTNSLDVLWDREHFQRTCLQNGHLSTNSLGALWPSENQSREDAIPENTQRTPREPAQRIRPENANSENTERNHSANPSEPQRTPESSRERQENVQRTPPVPTVMVEILGGGQLCHCQLSHTCTALGLRACPVPHAAVGVMGGVLLGASCLLGPFVSSMALGASQHFALGDLGWFLLNGQLPCSCLVLPCSTGLG